MRSGIKGSSWKLKRGMIVASLLLVGIAGCGGDEEPVPLPGDELFATFFGALPLDHVMERLPFGGITPSATVGENAIVHGYNVDRYLVDGETIAIVWIHDPALGFPATGDLRTQVNPMIFRNDVLDGWGWEHLDMRAAEWNIIDRSKPSINEVPAAPEEAPDTTLDAGTQASVSGGESAEGESEDSESFSF